MVSVTEPEVTITVRYTCSICGVACLSKVRANCFEHNDNDEKKNRIEYETEMIENTKCEKCYAEFRNSLCFHGVFGSNLEEKTKYTFKCTECPASYGRRDHLKRHTETKHNGMVILPSFQCTECGTNFKRKDHMMRHMKVKHWFGQEVHQCLLCPSTYKRKDHLQRHMREKHV